MTKPLPAPQPIRPLNSPDSLRVEYQIQVTSTTGNFMTWEGTFDLPGALAPSACHDNIKLFPLLTEQLIQRGASARFEHLLVTRYSALLNAEYAAASAAQKQPRPAAPVATPLWEDDSLNPPTATAAAKPPMPQLASPPKQVEAAASAAPQLRHSETERPPFEPSIFTPASSTWGVPPLSNVA